MRLSVVVLAGGRSRRMGRDKAALPVAGHGSLLGRQLALAAALQPRERLLSHRRDQHLAAPGDVRRIHDDGGAGPLGGVAAALGAMRGDALLVLAVDLPALQPDLLRRIVGAAPDFHGRVGVVPRGPGGPEPLAALLPRAALGLARERLARPETRAMRGFCEALVEAGLARWFDLAAWDEAGLRNWNHPSDRGGARPLRR